MIEICLIKVPVHISNYSELMNFVCTRKARRIEAYLNKIDAYRSLLSELLMKYLLMKYLKCHPSDINIQTNTYGKPYCINGDYEFNISHSGEWVIGIIGNCDVGIDIEEMKDNYEDEIIKNYFSSIEYASYNQTPTEMKKERFYDLWTLKEAFVKNIGLGLSIPLDSFSIETSHNEISIVQDISPYPYYFKQYNLINGYKISVCSKVNVFPSEQQLKIKEFSALEKIFLNNLILEEDKYYE
ncbi:MULTISPECIES: 4'-phosphopantetheinyl transferase family protein [Lysinibacillus]|uniref:4'-phosphopantetheinyl transferase family protein n=1 Tax=Lysinibacillus TaxID=400634 RepID=UPI0008862345|nr:4'-phosphopantetheinyl transferase superfamily protein [Lysinibacillus fusiformis]SCX59119.1 4'-phosphopantetheinyl transferase [Lysinibacillus fusiformis]SDB37117.1 4'-phosphopantetheinyl transferase [Lysinibacillus fusiformis]SFI40726.1 4'-phosphopantetheinyl transferase [Lysinibacillus fusiformis]SFT00712.1 4'-phosphopantetheinyl transferase [Lysinibacillus fusiformis]